MKYAEKIRALKDNGVLRRFESNLLNGGRDFQTELNLFKEIDGEIDDDICGRMTWYRTKEGDLYWYGLFQRVGGQF